MSSQMLKVSINLQILFFNCLETIGLGKDCSTESVSHDFSYMHQDKALLKSKPLGKWYNFAFVFRWILFIALALMSQGKPRTVYTIFWIIDLGMLAFSVLCLKTFMNFAGILIIIEEFCVLVWHFLIWIFFIDTPDNGYEKGTVKFWSIVMLICYLLCMLIEIILLFLGGKMCFKSKNSGSNVQQAPATGRENTEPTHFKVELPDSAKATLKSNNNANAI